MSETVFVDTNVLVYNRDLSEPAKQAKAAAWMRHLWTTRSGRTSFQVLQEYYVTVTRKLVPGLDRKIARQDVRSLMAWDPTIVDRTVLELAWTVQDVYSLSWWDALIVSAARIAGCSHLLTEDLQEGQTFDEVVVVNPFRTSPSEI